MLRVRPVQEPQQLAGPGGGDVLRRPRPVAEPGLLAGQSLELQRVVDAPLELRVLVQAEPAPQTREAGAGGPGREDYQHAETEDEGQPEDVEGIVRGVQDFLSQVAAASGKKGKRHMFQVICDCQTHLTLAESTIFRSIGPAKPPGDSWIIVPCCRADEKRLNASQVYLFVAVEHPRVEHEIAGVVATNAPTKRTRFPSTFVGKDCLMNVLQLSASRLSE